MQLSEGSAADGCSTTADLSWLRCPANFWPTFPPPCTSQGGEGATGGGRRAALESYRRLLTTLRSAAGVPEQKMSARQWDQINYERVPSVCMSLNKVRVCASASVLLCGSA